MKYDIYYQNSAGEKLDLCSIPYLLETANILDFKWDFTTSTNLNSYGGKIDSFTKGITSKKLELSVFAWTEEAYKKAINRLVDVLEYDVVNLTPGRLYCNGSYVSCYITSGEIEDWESPVNFMSVDLKITSEYPMWIIEREFNFTPTGNLAQGSKKYPNRYPYRYANGSTTGLISQVSNSPANFKIVFHGPVSDPQVTIGDKLYGVRDVDLEADDYVVIDSVNGTIRKYFKDGHYKNIFNCRTRDNSVFERLKSGSLQVSWTGEFLVSVTVFEERSLPRWN